MGAWGEGMRENDDAMDAISLVEEEVSRLVAEGRHEDAFDHISSCFDRGLEDHEYLGLAEWLMELGVPPRKLRDLRGEKDESESLEKCLQNELSDEELESWEDPDRRRRALELFGKRLREEPFTDADKDA